MVLLERFDQAELGGDVPPYPPADHEGDLVLMGEIAGIDQRHFDLRRARLEGDRVTALGELRRQQVENVIGNSPQILGRRAGDALLLGERAAQLLLGKRFYFEQAGSGAAAQYFLIAQGAQGLFACDLATLFEQLTRANWNRTQLDP